MIRVGSQCLFLTKIVSFQAWITLGRAQLNFGEPDSAIESFDKALAIKVISEISSFCFWDHVLPKLLSRNMGPGKGNLMPLTPTGRKLQPRVASLKST